MNKLYSDRTISIARLNAKIYSQREMLINYQNLLKEKKQENAQLHKFLEEFNALEVAKENDKLKTENKWYSEQLNEAVKEVSQLKKLLLTCREMLKEYQFSEGDFTIGDNAEIDTSLLLKMIYNAIGEKK